MSFLSKQFLALTATAFLSVEAQSASFGPAFGTGPVSRGTFIRESNATLILPPASIGSNGGDTALWVGMGTSNADLIQSIASNYDSDDWDLFAYTLKRAGTLGQNPIKSREVAQGDADDYVNFHYKLNDDTGDYDQVVSLNGVTVSTLSTSSGQARGWGSNVECASGYCGTVPAHSWIDVTITMDQPDPRYVRTLYKSSGVTGDLVTGDGGKTWTVDRIEIPEHQF
ncbi:hypothetical protein MBLNU230_g3196t1 [Neophaeotheca triangularis]